jgi:O-antigen/teichoic acid export membrane protein
VFRNTLAQALRLLTSQGFSFLLAPILISRLGLTLFGVWTVVGALVSYASVLDAGITRALARFVALYDAQNDERKIRETITVGVLAFTVLGIVLLPLGWFTGPLVAGAVGHVSGSDMSEILLASATMFILGGYAAVFQALPHGLRRMVPPNVAAVVSNAINFAASVGALLIGPSLVRYAWANALSYAVAVPLMLISVRYVWKTAILAIPRMSLVREILDYSLKSQIGWIADLVNLQTDKIIVGLVISPQAAGIYQLGSSVAGAVREIGVITISAMIPTATAEIAKGGSQAVKRLVARYLPLTLGISFPLFALGAVTAPFLLFAWIDEPTGDAVGVMIALCGAYAVNIVTGVPSTIALADGRPGFVSHNSMWMAIVNVVLTLALAPLFGVAGVVTGTVVAVSGLSAVLVWRFALKYRITRTEVWHAVFPAAAAAVLVGLPFAPAVIATDGLATSRLTAAALLIGFGLAYVLVYWPVASRIGVLPERVTLRRRGQGVARAEPGSVSETE